MLFYTAIRLDFPDKKFTYIEENDSVLFYNNTYESHSYLGSQWRGNHFELFLELLNDHELLGINRDFIFYPGNFLKIYPAKEKFKI